VSVFTFLNISKVQAGKPTKSPVVISMDPRKWNILYSVGMPRNPRATSSTSWIFDFPDISQGEIDYITQNVSGAIVGSNLIAELQITTQGNTVFDYKTESGNTCDFPAHVRFYIQRAWTNNNYDLWCVYTKYLEQENLPPACLRNPCPHIGQICSTGGVCEPPDQLDLRNNQDPQNPWGHCQKMVCRTAKDCLEPTPFCELGYCQSEHIIDLRP
jgi:hypothetical protein